MADGPTGRSEQQNGEVRDFTPTSSATHAVHLESGSVLFDKFKVIKLLGRGGMGSVYQVQHLHLRTEYALKCLNRQQQNDASWLRFENEARASNKLDHPNLIKVHDSGLLPDGQPYFVMDLVNGITLADEIKKTGRLPVNIVLKLFIQVGFALSYAHEHGVIHRDVKPTNIMLINNKDGTLTNSVKVVDFGIAKLTGQDEFNQQTLTRTGEIFGSPLYMSPEQCMGIAVDHRSDLYSLGCVMYEALTGAPPVVGDNALSTMMKHQSEKPLSLKQASLGLDFPEHLELLVQKLLEKDPKDRYSNASLLTSDLVALEQNLHTGVAMYLNVESGRLAPKLSEKQGWLSNPSAVAISLAAVICAYGLGVATGSMTSTSDKQAQQKMQGKAKKKQAPFEKDFFPVEDPVMIKARIFQKEETEKSVKPVSIDYKGKYFSKTSGKVRVFRFPKNASLGEISSTYDSEHYPRTNMMGDVPLQVPVTIHVNDNFLINPDLILKFQLDEVAYICFRPCEKSSAQFFSQAAKLPSIVGIELAKSAADTSDLKYLEKIPHLMIVGFGDSHMTIDDVIQFKKLPAINQLGIAGMKNVKPLIKILPKAQLLSRLVLRNCDLDIDDLTRISALKKIEYLDLTDVKSVNDKTMSIFSKSPTLMGFDLQGCKISTASIDTFKAIKRLNSLRLSDPEWGVGSESFQSKFTKALPHVSFTWL